MAKDKKRKPTPGMLGSGGAQKVAVEIVNRDKKNTDALKAAERALGIKPKKKK